MWSDDLTAKRKTLSILVVVYTLNLIDRQILGILGENVKQDLGLSDTQLGFLTGFAFVLFYVTMGIPIARLADRANRVKIIGASLFVWSVMTASCGMVQNIWQLALARMSVGVGESGCTPAAHSLISDLYGPKERATALATFSLGIPIGTFTLFMAGGWITEFLGWRVAFYALGLPGALLAFYVWRRVEEPVRGASESVHTGEPAPPLNEVLARLWNLPAYRHLVVGCSLAGMGNYGLVLWLAPYYIRVHGMSVGEVGTWLAIYLGLVSGIGTYAGGWISDRLGKINSQYTLKFVSVALIGVAPLAIAAIMARNTALSLGLLVVPQLLNSMWFGPTWATAQNLVPPNMRALTASILIFMMSTIGLGLGPQLVGILSDVLRPDYGIDSLRYGLATVASMYLWAAFHYWRSALHMPRDFAP